MFERFTDRGRQVVIFAQDEARALTHTEPDADPTGSERKFCVRSDTRLGGHGREALS
jgi:hypothetical protein